MEYGGLCKYKYVYSIYLSQMFNLEHAASLSSNICRTMLDVQI